MLVNENTLYKLDSLLENNYIELSNEMYNSAAWNAMTKEEQQKAMHYNAARNKGLMNAARGLGHGALVGGLAAGAAGLMTGGDPESMAISGLASAGLTTAANAPARYQDAKYDHENFQDVGIMTEKERAGHYKDYKKEMTRGGYDKVAQQSLARSLASEVK